jgi:hypothetical protein
MSNAALKKKRVDAGISRKVAADACGISQFRLRSSRPGWLDKAGLISSFAGGPSVTDNTRVPPGLPAAAPVHPLCRGVVWR